MNTKNKILAMAIGAFVALGYGIYLLFTSQPSEETETLLEQVDDLEDHVKALEKRALQAEAKLSMATETLKGKPIGTKHTTDETTGLVV